jgi:cytidine deaminase
MNAVFFPLLAMLLPQWQAKLDEKYGVTPNVNNGQSTPPGHLPVHASPVKCKKVLILVSGVGSPRNWTHSMDGNSTEQCAKLMALFIHTLYPDWVVVQVHSHTNIFRYDENISFVQNELLPCIQSYRDAHATGLAYPDEVSTPCSHGQNGDINKGVGNLVFDPEWHKTMNVTLSFADGSPARNHAIQAALRPYKPTYFHCWQLKTFWHESKIVDSDIEVHSFEEMETLPPIDLATPISKSRFQQQQPMALQVVQEMKAFKAQMDTILKQGNDDAHDLKSFWLRKTRKPVLAVLAVQMTKDGPVKLYRGTNMEVSMPTGSLCAERNVIGTALADNPMLRRHHLKIIAVLSVPPDNPNLLNTGAMPRPQSTTSLVSWSGDKASSRSNSIDIFDPPIETRPPRSSHRADSGEFIFRDVALPSAPFNDIPGEPSPVQTPPPFSSRKEGAEPPALALDGASSSKQNPPSAAVSPSTTPVRRIFLYQQYTPYNDKNDANGKGTRPRSHSHGQSKKRKTVLVQSPEDLNPLRPCGACNEWLKKIAETNPYFQILTFTDNECNGVYCTPVAE